MKVLALTPGPTHVSPGLRYRIEQWEPLLRQDGIDITYAPFMDVEFERVLYARGRTFSKISGMLSAYARQLGSIVEARAYDLVYVFREAALIGPAVIEPLIARRGTPIVFDFDDAIFVRYRSPSNAYWSYLKFAGKTATLCKKASHVMAGNTYLADYASRHNDAVTLIPTTIDTDLYRPERRRPRDDGTVTIGWTGSHSTARHLERLRPALTELAARKPFRLVVIGANAPEIPGALVEARRWSAETEVDDLSDVDIGIMPLPDDAWSRGKCGLKALQFMGLGIPAVVSPVGVNMEIIADGVNGLIADTDDEWLDRLTTLMNDATFRTKLGSAARDTVEQSYSAKRIAPQVAAIFRKATSA